MRKLFTTKEAYEAGLTQSALKWGVRQGRIRQIRRGVYGDGPHHPSPVEKAVADLMATGAVASGHLAGVLHCLDGVTLAAGSRPTRRRELPPERVVEISKVRCTDALQTLLDLAACVTDDIWEQALESALRKGLVSVAQIEQALTRRPRGAGNPLIRRVLALRPPGAPPTDSLLETLFLQLARKIPGLPAPVRQFRVENRYGDFVARLDTCWPSLGLFIELDGQQHKGQPVYDAHRETAVVAVTGWLCGRLTWDDVVNRPAVTLRRLAALVEQARRRPIPS